MEKDYKKMYEEALERARSMYEQDMSAERLFEYVFPELSESEDEKIRKEIIDFIKRIDFTKEKSERWITWLEKQCKEQNTKNYIQKFNIGDTICRQGYEDHTIKKIYNDGNFEPVYICKNEEGLESHISFSEQYKWKLKDENKYDKGFNDGFSASEHNRRLTEEDIKHIDNIIDCLEEFTRPNFPIYKGCVYGEIKWLENLKNNK